MASRIWYASAASRGSRNVCFDLMVHLYISYCTRLLVVIIAKLGQGKGCRTFVLLMGYFDDIYDVFVWRYNILDDVLKVLSYLYL